ncbi:hypothetical protein [Methylobacterium sp. 17Sr1-1]|uniref:DUF6894 family protein n=1 Tax=Methylobacterium sp. 17Sr1-1 TaxID=2202826 RepID=UPI0013A59F24|nr:hypothetical protein [Methylobacterium sp. 17Sr1-1]
MPRYRFSLKLGSRLVDGGAGIELIDESAAFSQAWHIGRVLLALPERGDDWSDGIIIIEADDGRDCFALYLSDVAAKNRSALLQ